MNSIEVCLTPDLIHQHELAGKIVVVVDIFRATSCIVTGLANGVAAIKPVGEIDEALELGKQGYAMAGERGGKKVDGFDMGNSPFEYMGKELVGKKVAISTTNGSKAILKSDGAQEILVGAFLNLKATVGYLLDASRSIVILCAGWKGTVNIEDTLYAGALIDELAEEMETSGDSAVLAHQLFVGNHENTEAIAGESSHAKRLAGFGVEKDLVFCMTENEYNIVVKLEGDHLVS
ncbi:MAG: 2-phosphosulfolactate phosphatase [Cytophagales bacterium]|nr:2-phosphosulfolactate phosphatase [Cytophagales bacterium]